jgi:homeobox protein cut-like
VDTLDDLSNPASEATSGGGLAAAAKRPRNPLTVTFSDEHKDALSIAFALDPFPSAATLEFLAAELGGGLDAKAVAQWFQSHRQRLKQLHGGEAVEHLLAGQAGGGGQSFDPTKFRFLLTHRRMEMAAAGNGAPVSPAPSAGFPAFPFFSNFVPGAAAAAAAAAAMFGLPPTRGGGVSSGLPPYGFEAAGLDLRFARGGGDANAGIVDAESNSGELSDGDAGSERKEEEGGSGRRSPPEQNLQRSRRKPALPQWVNPDWPADEKEREESGTGAVSNSAAAAAEAKPINGVCVRNMAAYGGEKEEEVKSETDLN